MRAAAIAVASLGLAVSSAAAQNVEYTPDFDPDRFVVTSDPYGIGLTESARPLARLEYTAGLALRVGGPPLSICVENDGTGECEVEGDLVNSRFGADLGDGADGRGRGSGGGLCKRKLHGGGPDIDEPRACPPAHQERKSAGLRQMEPTASRVRATTPRGGAWPLGSGPALAPPG